MAKQNPKSNTTPNMDELVDLLVDLASYIDTMPKPVYLEQLFNSASKEALELSIGARVGEPAPFEQIEKADRSFELTCAEYKKRKEGLAEMLEKMIEATRNLAALGPPERQ